MKRNVEPDSDVFTDGWQGYAGLRAAGYRHHKKIAPTKKAAAEAMPHVHLVISLLKRWMTATHQGAIRPTHLAAYLDEFAFRFNRRLSQHRGKLFHRLVQQAITQRPPAVKQLYVSQTQHVGAT